MSCCHPYELTNIETKYLQPHDSPMVVTSGYYIFKKKKRKRTMTNVINDKYNKNDIFLCFKNYTLLGGSSHCTLWSSKKKQHSKAIYKVPQSSTLQHCHASLHSPLFHTHSHTHIYAARVFTGHLQQEEGKSQSITRPNFLGLLELIC